jgi:hypothetical protein
VPSVTGRRLLLLGIVVGAAIVLAAAVGHSGGASRSAAAPELGQSAGQFRITCDQLEALRQDAIVIPRVVESDLLERTRSTLDEYPRVATIHGPAPTLWVEDYGPSLRTRILTALRRLRDAVGIDRDEPALSRPVVTLGAPDCNQ